MSAKFYPRHTTGRDDDVLVTMAHHGVSFTVVYFDGKIIVRLGDYCGMHLSVEQARGLRGLLDAGIADALEAAASRVDLVKAAA
ncbi:hypothetical protein ACQPXH_26170 [Nocardia sp. CA-135953]|uniref:hypothetical protein n=1 Tax=Nocardia sp. CA-135953 TaxID=3239978 RepID=UPI003D97F339